MSLETQLGAVEQREKMMMAIAHNLEKEKESNFALVQTSNTLEADLQNLISNLVYGSAIYPNTLINET